MSYNLSNTIIWSAVALATAQDKSYNSDLKQFCLFCSVLIATGMFYLFLNEKFEGAGNA